MISNFTNTSSNPYRKETKNNRDSHQQQQQVEEQENHLMNSINTSLHNFKITNTLGRGAGSWVYLTEEYKSGQLYALKTISKQSQYYANNIHRITNEYNLHSQLDHPNIVKILKRFEDAEYVYMMIDYCPGGSLFEYVKSKGRLNEEETRDISYQIVLGLEYLQKNKIIHRDLKPGNILLTGNNNVKICDFGLAVRLLDFDSERDTFCGTPNYIAPEICNRESYGMKSDLWSFGCILYTIATGRPPFETVSIKQTLNMLQKENKIEYPSHLSKSLVDLIDHVLNWNQEVRYTINQIKAHPFYIKCKDKFPVPSDKAEKEYKLQNPMTFAPPQQQQQQQQQQPQQLVQKIQQQNQQQLNVNTTSSNNKLQQAQPALRQRSNMSFDAFNSTKNMKGSEQPLQLQANIYKKDSNVLSSKENKYSNRDLNNFNENKENIHSNILNQINHSKQIQQTTKIGAPPIPLQKSSSLQSDQQMQIAQNPANSFRKDSSEQSIENHRKKIINEIQNQQAYNPYYNPQVSQQKQSQRQLDTSNTSNQTPQGQSKGQSKTILNTFLNKATKSNSLYQSSSTTPQNNQQTPTSNNFFQSQKSYKNPIVQILNSNPNQTKTQQTLHQKNKSFDISTFLPPQSTLLLEDSKKAINNSSQSIENPHILIKQNSTDPQNQNLIYKDSNICPRTPNGSNSIQFNNNGLSQSSNNMIFLQDNNNSKMQNIRKKTSLHYPSDYQNMKQDILGSNNVSCKNNSSQNMKFPPPPQPPLVPSQSQQNQLNASTQNVTQSYTHKRQASHSNHISSSNTTGSMTNKFSNLNNSNNSFDISQLKLDHSQMNNFSSSDKEFQSTAQFTSKSNAVITPSNASMMRSKPPQIKNPQTYRETNPPSFAPSSSILRARGTSKEYIRTEPCENEINQTPRLECLETENNTDTSTTACSKYSMSTTNRSFTKGLNTSKSFSSFIVDPVNENDKSQAIIQQSSNPIVNQISPVKVGDDLDISKIQTKNGYIEITADHSLLVESCNGRLLFKISQDGQKIQINKLIDKPMEKHYTLDNLPTKYYALYGYAKQVINALKSKKVISKLENKEGVFTLLENNCFEAQFKAGYKVYYKNKSAYMRIKAPDNKIYEISLEKSSKDFPDEVKSMTTKSIKYYEYLLNQNKEFQNI